MHPGLGRPYVGMQVKCMLVWGHDGACTPIDGILSALECKRQTFMHSPTTFWTLGSQPLNRSLVPFAEWRAPFVVEDVFLPMPKSCSGCTEEVPAGAHVACWQASSYMHCRCANFTHECFAGCILQSDKPCGAMRPNCFGQTRAGPCSHLQAGWWRITSRARYSRSRLRWPRCDAGWTVVLLG